LKFKKRKDSFDDSTINVPFFVPDISREDKIVVHKALSSLLLTAGPILSKFEKNFANFTNSKYAIGVSNATSALFLSLKSLGIGKGDEVIVPDITFIATANAVLLAGATPVIVDVNDDLNISVKSIKDNLTKKTKAIIPVHLTGKICDIEQICKLAHDNNIFVVEDCAHGIGAFKKNKHVGTFGDIGCFSFYPTKNITTIEGGMIITKSKKLSENIQSARNHGITKTLTQRYSSGLPWDYDVSEPGFNYRLDEVRSALGLNQLKRIQKLNQKRKNVCMYYNKKLSHIDGIKTPEYFNDDSSYHLYIIRIQDNFGMSRNSLFKNLLKSGIRTSVHYKPLHEFTAIKKLARISKNLEKSKSLYPEILSLPLFPQITKKEQDLVVKSLASNKHY
jgi:perosamine synthetase